MSDAGIRLLTLALGGIVLLSSAMSLDRDHRPPAGARAAIELIADRRMDSRGRRSPKSSWPQVKMDAASKRGVDWSGKIHSSTGDGLRLLMAAANPHEEPEPRTVRTAAPIGH